MSLYAINYHGLTSAERPRNVWRLPVGLSLQATDSALRKTAPADVTVMQRSRESAKCRRYTTSCKGRSPCILRTPFLLLSAPEGTMRASDTAGGEEQQWRGTSSIG